MSRLPFAPDAQLPRPRQPSGDRHTRITVGALTPTPCFSTGPELWFSESPAELEVAKELCGYCPQRTECLAGAIQRGEPWGVWGGEIFQDGVVIARKRPRGRPRKDEHAA